MGGCHELALRRRLNCEKLSLKGKSMERCEWEVADDVLEKSEKELYETAEDGGSESESLLIRRLLFALVSDPSKSEDSPVEKENASGCPYMC